MPIDQLNETFSCWLTWLVEEYRLFRGTSDEPTSRCHTNDGTGTEQTNSRRLRRVTQGAGACERSDEEVAVRHADLETTLPRLQALSVVRGVSNEIFGKA